MGHLWHIFDLLNAQIDSDKLYYEIVFSICWDIFERLHSFYQFNFRFPLKKVERPLLRNEN